MSHWALVPQASVPQPFPFVVDVGAKIVLVVVLRILVENLLVACFVVGALMVVVEDVAVRGAVVDDWSEVDEVGTPVLIKPDIVGMEVVVDVNAIVAWVSVVPISDKVEVVFDEVVVEGANVVKAIEGDGTGAVWEPAVVVAVVVNEPVVVDTPVLVNSIEILACCVVGK